MKFGATLHHASHTRLHISSFFNSIWPPISFFIIFQTFSMEFMSGELHGHSETGIYLHSRNVLVLLELGHGVRSCIKIYPFCWEHNAFTCHFNIVNNILQVFCIIHVTIHFSQKRQAFAANGSSDFYTNWRFNSSLNRLSMIFLILFAPNTTMASIIMIVKYRLT